jgi:hypothetical protein
LLVALNFGHEPQELPLPTDCGKCAVLLSSHMDREGPATTVSLRADEGVVALLRE